MAQMILPFRLMVAIVLISMQPQAVTQTEKQKELAYAQVTKLCSEELPVSRPKCNRLIKKILQRVDIRDNIPDRWLLVQAYAGLSLRLHQLPEKDQPAAKTKLIAKRFANYQAMLDLDPENTTALLGIAGQSPRPEKLRLMRKIMVLNPVHIHALRMIHSILSNGDESERDEAERHLLKAYQLLDRGYNKWRAAWDLYLSYSVRNKHKAALALRQRVMRDAEINNDPESYKEAIQQINLGCGYLLIDLDLAGVCLKTIRMVIDYGSQADKRVHRDSSELMLAIQHLRGYHIRRSTMTHDLKMELSQIFKRMESSGIQPTAFYMTYSQLVDGDMKIVMLRKAVVVDPNGPALAAYWLAGTLANVGQLNEAIEIYKNIIAEGDEFHSGLAENKLQQLRETKGYSR